MKAIEISAPGGPEVLKITERPMPQPQTNEILVRVVAAGVNGPDIMQRKGLYPPPPGASDLPGLEIAGEVVAVGQAVKRWKVGDSVCALVNGGGYAQYCVADAEQCLPVPAGVELRDAAGLPETFFTVWSNIFIGAGLKSGENLLVHGGAGGIGTTAIQLGKAFGAKVMATDSPEARCRICRELGADRVIDYKEEDFVEIVRQEGGANVILDIVGGPNIERNFKAASHDARIVQLAFAMGSKVEVNLMPVMLKRLTYTGSTLRTRPAAFKARIARELEAQVWPHIEAGRIRVVTRQTYPLASAAEAHAAMESAAHVGKILLVV
jgi:putative PIG3 family NAD(P)H quinone oxidoreductase